MAISLQADPSLPQGYIQINGSTALTFTTTGMSAASLQDNTITTAKIADSAITPSKLSQKLTSDTAKASTSGTSVDFTGIPSWAKRITVMFDGVSTNGTSAKLIQLGDAGGVETTGYLGGSQTSSTAGGVSGVNSTAGIPINSVNATDSIAGSVIFSLLNASTNTWVAQGAVRPTANQTTYSAGSKSLSDTLTQVRVTTVNGTDTFDAGTINISYE